MITDRSRPLTECSQNTTYTDEDLNPRPFWFKALLGNYGPLKSCAHAFPTRYVLWYAANIDKVVESGTLHPECVVLLGKKAFGPLARKSDPESTACFTMRARQL
eukprot:5229937-Amphidinium_carterae.1